MVRGAFLAPLVFGILAGCASPGPSALSDDDAMAPAPTAAAALDAASVVQAPTWAVGQWWEWEISFGSQTNPDTFCSIVLSTQGGSYTLVTEDEARAKHDAAFDQPLLGMIGKGSLAMDGWGQSAWSLLSFPLRDGATWSSSIPNIAWDIVPEETVQLAMEATFDGQLDQGAGGYRIRGLVGTQTLLEATYLPATGWFSELLFYDVDPGEEALEVGYRAVATGSNYTGPILQATATQVLDWTDGVGFDGMPTEGGQPFAEPHPYTDFVVEGGDGHVLYGLLAVEAVVGSRSLVLIDPDNQARDVHATSTQLDSTEGLLFLDEPARAGQWRLASTGAGGYSAAGADIFELVVLQTTL